MSANRLRLQGSINEETRTDERDVNTLLLGFYRALLREAADARERGQAAPVKDAGTPVDQAAGASE